MSSTSIGRHPAPRGRWLARLLAALLVLVLAAIAALGIALWATLPAGNATVRLAGLSAPVEIALDSHGIPRIRAASETDAAAALGYMHARDRLFQMELTRRAAFGELAALVGPAALPLDRTARVLGQRLHAERMLAALSPDARALLDAYARGVNAWIGERGRLAAPEFLLLGAPRPWTPLDSLGWAETMIAALSDNWAQEAARAALAPVLSLDHIRELWSLTAPAKAADAAINRDYASLLRALPHGAAGMAPDRFASNAWAVDGAHSATGAPLLAGDPHLNFTVPGTWYLARIDLPGRTLAGATAPGVPFLILGQNGRIAWSVTAAGVDTQDLFEETPLAGTQLYATPDGPKPFILREERIAVRGGADVVLHVRATRHGPIVSDLDPDHRGKPVALARASEDQVGLPDGLLALDHAATVEEAAQAAARIGAPVLNLVVADRQKIGMAMTGAVPIRKSGDGAFPTSGETGATDWVGTASGPALPQIVAPAEGFVFNANQRWTTPSSTVFLGADDTAHWRADRIRAVLAGRRGLSLDDFSALQNDVVSGFAVALQPRLKDLPERRDISGEATSRLRDWDGALDKNRPEPLIFEAGIQNYAALILSSSRVPLEDAGDWTRFSLWSLTNPGGAFWCGGDCRRVLGVAFSEAAAKLSARDGTDIAQWRWGSVHRAHFAHPFTRLFPALAPFLSRDIPVGGDGDTVFAGSSGVLGDFTDRHGPGFRGLYDLADPSRSRFVAPPGQSGNFLSPHAWDMLDSWAAGATIPLGATPESVSARVRLLP